MCRRAVGIVPLVMGGLLVSSFWVNPLLAQQSPAAAKPVAGTLHMSGIDYNLSNAVAYESKYLGDPAVAVLVSDRALDGAKILAVLKENDGDDSELSLRQPHLKVVFSPKGKPLSFYAYAAGFTTNGSGGKVAGELKLAAGRVSGKAAMERAGAEKLARGFDFTFDVPVLGTGSAADAPAPAAPLAKVGVSGKFAGNGKETKLAFISASPREPFADKPSLRIVITEKDHSRDPKPDFRAGFGDYGGALVISCHEDGTIFGCEVWHPAHEKKGFSSVGNIGTVDFQIAGGQVQGGIKTDGEAKFFDDRWEVDLKFAAPYAGSKGTTTTPMTPDVPAPRSTTPTTAAPSKPAAPASTPAGEKLNVKDLAILQGVEGVEYKKIVQQLSFTSDKDYKTLAAELAPQLAAQGWKTDGRDLVGVSAILKRTRGDASLTIFVKPAGSGSTVSVMTKGLAWE
jgi:hypothetical protein